MSRQFNNALTAFRGASAALASRSAFTLNFWVNPGAAGNLLQLQFCEAGAFFDSAPGGPVAYVGITDSGMEVINHALAGRYVLFDAPPGPCWVTVVFDGSLSGTARLAAYYNGASQTISSSSGTPVAATPATLDEVAFGYQIAGTVDAALAEVAVWTAALNAEETAFLGSGGSPLLIRPGALAHYWPFMGRASGEEDWVGSTPLALTNTSPVTDHPRVLYDERYRALFAPATGGGNPVLSAATVFDITATTARPRVDVTLPA